MAEKASIRQRMRTLIHEELTESALGLFLERGFDRVSVDDIAAGAGISQRTFFRYFPTKEDVALHVLDETGPIIRQALAGRPVDESPLTALRFAFLAVFAADPDLARRSGDVLRLALGSPRLMAGMEARRRVWEDLIAEILATRAGRTTTEDPTFRVWAAAALSITFSSTLWSVQNGLPDDSQGNVERAFDALTDLVGTTGSTRRGSAVQ